MSHVTSSWKIFRYCSTVAAATAADESTHQILQGLAFAKMHRDPHLWYQSAFKCIQEKEKETMAESREEKNFFGDFFHLLHIA